MTLCCSVAAVHAAPHIRASLLWVISLLFTVSGLSGFDHVNQGANDCETVWVGDSKLHCKGLIGETPTLLLFIAGFSHLSLMASFPPCSNHLSSWKYTVFQKREFQ